MSRVSTDVRRRCGWGCWCVCDGFFSLLSICYTANSSDGSPAYLDIAIGGMLTQSKFINHCAEVNEDGHGFWDMPVPVIPYSGSDSSLGSDRADL